jgi:hypothetical protein
MNGCLTAATALALVVCGWQGSVSSAFRCERQLQGCGSISRVALLGCGVVIYVAGD